jgi:hypothetical protein
MQVCMEAKSKFATTAKNKSKSKAQNKSFKVRLLMQMLDRLCGGPIKEASALLPPYGFKGRALEQPPDPLPPLLAMQLRHHIVAQLHVVVTQAPPLDCDGFRKVGVVSLVGLPCGTCHDEANDDARRIHRHV